jgi:superfamily II DNA or RNA helicase
MDKNLIQQKAFESINFKSRNGIIMSMGTGKTRLGLNCCTHFLEANKTSKILIVYPKLAIKEAWLNEMKLIDFKYEKRLTFSTIISVCNKNDVSNYDLIIVDECHSITERSYECLKKAKSIIGLTGTPIKNEKSDKYFIYNKLFPTVFSYAVKDAIKDSLLNNFKLIVHRIPLSSEKNIKVNWNGKSFYVSERSQYDSISRKIQQAYSFQDKKKYGLIRLKNIKEFNSKVFFLQQKILPYVVNKTLLFTSTIDQSDLLAINSYNSKNLDSKDNLTKFCNGEINLLSCVEQLSEGVNIPDLKEGIIMHSYGSEVKLSQKIGRILRLNPKDLAVLHIIVYRDTVDWEWVMKALQGKFDNTMNLIDYDSNFDKL